MTSTLQESLPAVVLFLEGQVELPIDLLRQRSLADTRMCSFLGGSLVEGLGNRTSDLDIYSIGESLPELRLFQDMAVHRLLTPDRRILRRNDDLSAPVFIAHYSLGNTQMKVDVEFQTLANVRQLAERVRELHRYAASNLVLLTKRLGQREEDFVTRLLNGQPLSGNTLFHSLQADFSRANVEYLAYRWLASDFANLLDLIGAWAAGDADRALDLARENMIKQMQAYLHLRGMMNLRRKWLLVFVDRLLADEATLAARFRSLFFFDGRADARTFIDQTLDLVDELFARSGRELIRNGTAPTGVAAIELLSRDRDLSCSTYADVEFEYRAKVYRGGGRPTRQFLDMKL